MDNRFHKYTALGNDMIVIDPKQVNFELTPNAIQKICDRHFGIGADGICHGPLTYTQPFDMQFYNPDGSEAGKSGNGLRIFARYLCDANYVRNKQFQISIDNQISDVYVLDDTRQTLKISMGKATFQSDQIPVTGEIRQVINEPTEIDGINYLFTAVNVGNPHCVLFTDELSLSLVKSIGAKLEVHSQFPQRTNVQWVQIIDEHTIRIEIWERGAGYTLASGTSSCATACAAIVNGYCQSPVTVQMAKGQMTVTVDEQWNIELTGSVQVIATGQFSPDFIRQFI
jgi:diaminopimelate epimerase